MKNSTITSTNNFATAKMLSIVLVGILVFGTLTSLPFGYSKIVEGRMKIENLDTKSMGSSFDRTLDVGKNDGISIHGCDQSGTRGGISIYGCARGGDGPHGGKGGIGIFGIANGGDGGADGSEGLQGKTGTAFGNNAGTGGVGGSAFGGIGGDGGRGGIALLGGTAN